MNTGFKSGGIDDSRRRDDVLTTDFKKRLKAMGVFIDSTQNYAQDLSEVHSTFKSVSTRVHDLQVTGRDGVTESVGVWRHDDGIYIVSMPKRDINKSKKSKEIPIYTGNVIENDETPLSYYMVGADIDIDGPGKCKKIGLLCKHWLDEEGTVAKDLSKLSKNFEFVYTEINNGFYNYNTYFQKLVDMKTLFMDYGSVELLSYPISQFAFQVARKAFGNSTFITDVTNSVPLMIKDGFRSRLTSMIGIPNTSFFTLAQTPSTIEKNDSDKVLRELLGMEPDNQPDNKLDITKNTDEAFSDAGGFLALDSFYDNIFFGEGLIIGKNANDASKPLNFMPIPNGTYVAYSDMVNGCEYIILPFNIYDLKTSSTVQHPREGLYHIYINFFNGEYYKALYDPNCVVTGRPSFINIEKLTQQEAFYTKWDSENTIVPNVSVCSKTFNTLKTISELYDSAIRKDRLSYSNILSLSGVPSVKFISDTFSNISSRGGACGISYAQNTAKSLDDSASAVTAVDPDAPLPDNALARGLENELIREGDDVQEVAKNPSKVKLDVLRSLPGGDSKMEFINVPPSMTGPESILGKQLNSVCECIGIRNIFDNSNVPASVTIADDRNRLASIASNILRIRKTVLIPMLKTVCFLMLKEKKQPLKMKEIDKLFESILFNTDFENTMAQQKLNNTADVIQLLERLSGQQGVGCFLNMDVVMKESLDALNKTADFGDSGNLALLKETLVGRLQVENATSKSQLQQIAQGAAAQGGTMGTAPQQPASQPQQSSQTQLP